MALKQISPSQVELGMFIHSFQGSWLNHPFWRARFLINDEDRLQAVRDSALDGVVIDTERGIDLLVREPASPLRPPLLRSAASAPTPRREAANTQRPPAILAPIAHSGRVPVAREFGNARRAVGAARKVITEVFIEARLGKAPSVTAVTPVVEDIYASIERNPHAFSGLMRCKSDMEPIYQHMLSVSALMVSLARQMKRSPTESRNAGMVGLLLDIGISQLGIDAATLAGGVDAIDAELWQRHCFVGHDLLAAAEGVPEEVLNAVKRHHELMDGTGFPQGLDGRQLDLYSRMAAICDRFDLLVSGVATGQAIDPAEAMRVMLQAGTAFDQEILTQFGEALGVYPVGSFVVLRSGRIAMVVDQDPSDAALPTVRTFHSAITGKAVPQKTISLANCFGADAIVSIANLDDLDLPPAAELREKLFSTAARAAP